MAFEVIHAGLTRRADDVADDEWEQEIRSLPAADLRRLCADRDIPWRDARGKGKHMGKAAMVAALLS